MASFQIPEEIIGLPLFVPSANNFFEIVDGGMPNGDACLRVRGDINRNYKAFMEPPTTVPAVFTDPTSINWAMTVWLKLGSHANIATANFDQTLFTVCHPSFNALTHAENAYQTPTGVGHVLWGMYAKGTSGVRFSRFSANVTSGSGAAQANSGNLSVDTWTMLTFNCATSVLGSMFINDAATAVSSGSGTNFGGGPNPSSDRFLCIGAYSDLGSNNGREGDWSIGKLGFHDHQLNQTERTLLYNAMIN